MLQTLTKRDRVTALPSMRAAVSDVWVPRYRSAMEALLSEQAEQAAHDWEVLETLRTGWQEQMETAQLPLALTMAMEGYQFAEAEFGKREALETMQVKAALDWDAWIEEWAEDETQALLAQKVEPRVRGWVESRTKSVTGTTLQRASHIIKEGQADGATTGEIARRLEDGLKLQSRARANMIARSATIWNYNEGAQQRYADAGVTRNEWLLTDDDMLCEFCEAMAAEVNSTVPLGEAFVKGGQQWTGSEGGSMNVEFDVEHPPLHPNCRCTLIPIF